MIQKFQQVVDKRTKFDFAFCYLHSQGRSEFYFEVLKHRHVNLTTCLPSDNKLFNVFFTFENRVTKF